MTINCNIKLKGTMMGDEVKDLNLYRTVDGNPKFIFKKDVNTKVLSYTNKDELTFYIVKNDLDINVYDSNLDLKYSEYERIIIDDDIIITKDDVIIDYLILSIEYSPDRFISYYDKTLYDFTTMKVYTSEYEIRKILTNTIILVSISNCEYVFYNFKTCQLGEPFSSRCDIDGYHSKKLGFYHLLKDDDSVSNIYSINDDCTTTQLTKPGITRSSIRIFNDGGMADSVVSPTVYNGTKRRFDKYLENLNTNELFGPFEDTYQIGKFIKVKISKYEYNLVTLVDDKLQYVFDKNYIDISSCARHSIILCESKYCVDIYRVIENHVTKINTVETIWTAMCNHIISYDDITTVFFDNSFITVPPATPLLEKSGHQIITSYINEQYYTQIYDKSLYTTYDQNGNILGYSDRKNIMFYNKHNKIKDSLSNYNLITRSGKTITFSENDKFIANRFSKIILSINNREYILIEGELYTILDKCKLIGSRNDTCYVYGDNGVKYSTGCFNGTEEDLMTMLVTKKDMHYMHFEKYRSFIENVNTWYNSKKSKIQDL
jgi:hypothetical protein